MAFLTINGLTLPVAAGSCEETKREIGETEAAFSGSLKRARQAVKYDIAFETTPLVTAEAFAWDSLIRGLGHVWSFNSSLYSSKGKVPGTVTGCALDASEKKHGANGLSVTTGNTFAPASAYISTTGTTVMFWYESTAAGGFTHYIVTCDYGNNRNYWTNGASKTSGEPQEGGSDIIDFSGGTVTLTAHGATRYFDDFVVLGSVIPDSWAAALYTWHDSNAWSSLPFLTAEGDALWEGASRSVLGMSEKSRLISGVVSSSFVVNARTLSVLLQQA